MSQQKEMFIIQQSTVPNMSRFREKIDDCMCSPTSFSSLFHSAKFTYRTEDGTFITEEFYTAGYVKTREDLQKVVSAYMHQSLTVSGYKAMCVSISKAIYWKYPMYNLNTINGILRTYEIQTEIRYDKTSDSSFPMFDVIDTSKPSTEHGEEEFNPYAIDDPDGVYPGDDGVEQPSTSSGKGRSVPSIPDDVACNIINEVGGHDCKEEKGE